MFITVVLPGHLIVPELWFCYRASALLTPELRTTEARSQCYPVHEALF